jgi:hypothetical protein
MSNSERLKNEINDLDAQGYLRNIKILSDNFKVFVSSGDDNALAIFNVDSNLTQNVLDTIHEQECFHIVLINQ